MTKLRNRYIYKSAQSDIEVITTIFTSANYLKLLSHNLVSRKLNEKNSKKFKSSGQHLQFFTIRLWEILQQKLSDVDL